MAIMSKSRNRLTEVGHDFRCALSEVVPRIDLLVEKKQLHFLNQIVISCYSLVLW